ncbi:MAG: BatA domain-containing protein [Planctomycetes bacterium]|nr:BatA domain-containing protein [Planctomycetota bacterium]
MPSFLLPAFAVAAGVVALGPAIIHLLNRRRFRLVDWAAMDFLREALQRNRRIMQLRDLLLLALRTAAIALFALALSRPYFTSSDTVVDPDQPVHAVIAIDNSLSMAYRGQTGTLLEQAKIRAVEFIDELPEQSRISVIAICGPNSVDSLDAYLTKEDAREALERIVAVDRAADVSVALDEIKKACDNVSGMAKRVVLFGDQQESFWNGVSIQALANGPELQIVSVAPEERENIWISDFRLRENIADTNVPTEFLVTVRYEGARLRESVQVVLSVGDKQEVASTNISLQPGQSRLITFKHQIRIQDAEPSADLNEDQALKRGEVRFIAAKAEVRVAAGGKGDAATSEERLQEDDSRYLSVPVASALPVVFVDELGGKQENSASGQFGETRKLRLLLAPGSTSDSQRQMIAVRHVRIEELDREMLADARLVVIAGVESPAASVDLLREYVVQGGQLFIAAGANFDPEEWNRFAWRDGQGILPMPLAGELLGMMQDEVKSGKDAFELSFDSMRGSEQFMLPGDSEESLEDFYSSGLFFFRTAVAELNDSQRKRMRERAIVEIEKARDSSRQVAERRRKWEREGGGRVPDKYNAELARDEQQLARLQPAWLTWADRVNIGDDTRSAEELADQGMPRVLARYTNDLPFLIERSIGRGQVMMTTTALRSKWNTFWKDPQGGDVMFDRIVRLMLHRTLEYGDNRRNFSDSTGEESIRIAARLRKSRITLEAPGEAQQVLRVVPTGSGTYQARLTNLNQRGVYWVRAYSTEAESADALTKQWEAPLAINGPTKESELAAITPAQFRERVGEDERLRWVGPGDKISQSGAQVWGAMLGIDWWKWLIALAGLCLLAEMGILAWPVLRNRFTASPER